MSVPKAKTLQSLRHYVDLFTFCEGRGSIIFDRATRLTESGFEQMRKSSLMKMTIKMAFLHE